MKQEQQYHQLFSRLIELEPRASLEASIMAEARRIQKARARVRAGAHAFLAFAGLIGFIPAFKLLATNAGQSGFLKYASLGLSDGTTVIGSWKTFVLSMIESAPIFETSIVLGLILLCAYSLRKGARYASEIFGASSASYASL